MRWWLCFSGALHLVMAAMLLAASPGTARRDVSARVYTVDLVAPGSRAPAAKPPPVLAPAAPAPPESIDALEKVEPVETPPGEQPEEAHGAAEEPPPRTEPAPSEKPRKKAAAPRKPSPSETVPKPEKKPAPKVVEDGKPAPGKASPGKVSGKPSRGKTARVSKKPPAGKPSPAQSRLRERLRERRIDDAVAVARERARLRRAARREGNGGDGTGAVGSRGIVRGMEFLAYRNQMLNRIKARWTWLGKRAGLEVTLGFGVGADGEIFGLRLLASSGDASFDDSVVRAVGRSSPLPPPPPGHVRDFAEVEVTFRPIDLGG